MAQRTPVIIKVLQSAFPVKVTCAEFDERKLRDSLLKGFASPMKGPFEKERYMIAPLHNMVYQNPSLMQFKDGNVFDKKHLPLKVDVPTSTGSQTFYCFALLREKRVVKDTAINLRLYNAKEEYKAKNNGEKMPAPEVDKVKSDISAQMIRDTDPSIAIIPIYICPEAGLGYFGVSKKSDYEKIVDKLAQFTPGITFTPIKSDLDITAPLTSSIQFGVSSLPPELRFGSFCDLTNTNSGVATLRKHNLDCSETKIHVNSGKTVRSIEMLFGANDTDQPYFSFKLSNALGLQDITLQEEFQENLAKSVKDELGDISGLSASGEPEEAKSGEKDSDKDDKKSGPKMPALANPASYGIITDILDMNIAYQIPRIQDFFCLMNQICDLDIGVLPEYKGACPEGFALGQGEDDTESDESKEEDVY